MERLQRRFEADQFVRRGVCLLNAAKYDEAAEAFAKAEERGSTEESLPVYAAACLLGKDRPGLAAEQFARLAFHDPDNPTHRIRHALALAESGDAKSAMSLLRDAVRDNPESADLHFQLGTLLAAQDRYEEAELRFTQAISIDREHAEALVGLALVCGVRQAPGSAVGHLQKAQALRPFDARIGLLLAEAAKASQQQGYAVRVKATISPDECDDRRGIDDLSRVIESDPDFVDAFLSIPAGCVDGAVFAMLLETLKAALERQPEHAELHYHCGRVLDRLGRRGDAIGENEKAVALNPNLTKALIELGKLYQATDRAEDAATRLEQAIAAGAEYADVYFMLGNLYRVQGQIGRARSAYRRALAINERYEAAHQALAELPA
jgi:tetratricopeptide (TPR) repeat protein